MPEKEAPQLETWEGQDFKNLELEIDKEIDSLFVPAVRMADCDAVAGACPDQDSHPQTSKPSEAPGSAVNLDAIQIEIDREIDTLFAPSPPSDSLPVSSTFSESLDPRAGLSGLIEQFNAAYLSLDWDFSRQNLKKFIDALEQLEPMASRSSDAKSVFRIIEVILKRLLDRPHAVNTKLVELIRDSQGLLAHILLIDGESGPHEKRRLKELVEKFQELRQMALAAKAAAAGEGVPSRAARDHGLAESPPAKSGVPPEPVTALNRFEEKTSRWAENEDIAQAAASAPYPREKTGAVRRRVRQADACLLVSEGKCFALPASCVVKQAQLTHRIGRKVLKRGYATLSDFRPLFRSPNSGVLGAWAKLHPKELGSYRFEPLEFDPSGRSSGTGPIAVLASDGETHRIIFCDAFHFISGAQIAYESSAQDTPSFKSESRVMVPFFDLPSMQRQ